VAYRIEFKPAAVRAVAALPKPDQRRIRTGIDALAAEPRPPGTVALQGSPEAFLRIRSGDYRIIYLVQDRVLLVIVVTIGHRRDVYRR
jgi:mRNA interferase RelE/StbE